DPTAREPELDASEVRPRRGPEPLELGHGLTKVGARLGALSEPPTPRPEHEQRARPLERRGHVVEVPANGPGELLDLVVGARDEPGSPASCDGGRTPRGLDHALELAQLERGL